MTKHKPRKHRKPIGVRALDFVRVEEPKMAQIRVKGNSQFFALWIVNELSEAKLHHYQYCPPGDSSKNLPQISIGSFVSPTETPKGCFQNFLVARPQKFDNQPDYHSERFVYDNILKVRADGNIVITYSYFIPCNRCARDYVCTLRNDYFHGKTFILVYTERYINGNTGIDETDRSLTILSANECNIEVYHIAFPRN